MPSQVEENDFDTKTGNPESFGIKVFKKGLRMLWSILFIVGGVYLGLGLLLFLFQAQIIYHPSRAQYSSPDDYGLPFEDVFFETADGVRLHGWFIPAKDAKATILFFHGNAGNITHRLDTIKLINGLGFNFFIIDYRGYGRSEGAISEEGTYRDAEAAWKWLTDEKKILPERIVLMGRSLGGAVAAKLAVDHPPAALVLESTFVSVPQMATDLYRIFPGHLLARIKYPTIDHIKKIGCPKLIAHSPQDEIIPYKHGQQLFKVADEPKKFFNLIGPHNDCFFISGSPYLDSLKDFIDQAVVTKP